MNEPKLLTPFQKECLYKASIGGTHKIIARELYISTTSVNGYLRGARRKLNAETTTHAVRLAIEQGLI